MSMGMWVKLTLPTSRMIANPRHDDRTCTQNERCAACHHRISYTTKVCTIVVGGIYLKGREVVHMYWSDGEKYQCTDGGWRGGNRGL